MEIVGLWCPAILMTDNPPKRAPKPSPNYIALVVGRHVRRHFGFKVKAQMLEREIWFLGRYLETGAASLRRRPFFL